MYIVHDTWIHNSHNSTQNTNGFISKIPQEHQYIVRNQNKYDKYRQKMLSLFVIRKCILQSQCVTRSHKKMVNMKKIDINHWQNVKQSKHLYIASGEMKWCYSFLQLFVSFPQSYVNINFWDWLSTPVLVMPKSEQTNQK